MSFALRYGQRDYPLGEGRFSIGRSEDCDLCLDDPMASRNHAAIVVETGFVRVEDLESRNGVFVNHERIHSSVAIQHGDMVRVGSQEMKLVRRGGLGRAETLAGRPVTARLQAFGVLGSLAEKALALGRGDEAERIVGRQLEQFLQRAESGEALKEDEFERAIHYAYKIGVLLKRGKWLDYIFRMYAAHERLMDAELVNRLYDVSGKMLGTSRSHFRGYVASLQPHAGGYAPGERFVLKRIEGLEGLLG